MRKLMLFLTIAAAALSAASAVSAEALRAPGGGTIRALVVGVDVYSRLPASVQLQGARADAEDIAEALQRGGVKPVTLFDTDVTRARIVAQMDSFVADSKPGDFVLFAYAGHGMQTPEYARWQGIDANGVNEQIALSGFSFSGDGVDEIIVNPEIRAWLTRLDAKGVDALVVMDSCFGGGMREVDPRTGAIRTRVLRASAAQIRAGEDERAKFAGIPMTEKEARANVELMSHVTFLAGATSRSVVPETDGLAASGPRGALSYYLARALRGEIAKDGVTTRQALFGYLKPNIRGATQDRQLIQVEPQSPEAAVYGKPVLTFAEAAPGAQAANAPPAADNGAPADNGAAPSAQAQNAPSDGPPPDQAKTPGDGHTPPARLWTAAGSNSNAGAGGEHAGSGRWRTAAVASSDAALAGVERPAARQRSSAGSKTDAAGRGDKYPAPPWLWASVGSWRAAAKRRGPRRSHRRDRQGLGYDREGKRAFRAVADGRGGRSRLGRRQERSAVARRSRDAVRRRVADGRRHRPNLGDQAVAADCREPLPVRGPCNRGPAFDRRRRGED